MACVNHPARQRLHDRRPNKHAGERISGNGQPAFKNRCGSPKMDRYSRHHRRLWPHLTRWPKLEAQNA